MTTTGADIYGWMYGYDRRAGIWCGYHKDNPEEEWNAYTLEDLKTQMLLREHPNQKHLIKRQVVKR